MKMRRSIIAILLILAMGAGMFVSLFLGENKPNSNLFQVQAANYEENGSIRYRKTSDVSCDYGTTQKPFTILEIVPYIGYAEIGYLIGGKEPVNLERLSQTARGEIPVGGTSTSQQAATEFIEHLVDRGYLEKCTEAEALAEEAKNSERFRCYRYAQKMDESTKCYVTNANSFLRESIGLRYLNDGNTINYGQYDVETYEFLGWYQEGTNAPFVLGEKQFTDVELYAKWRVIKSDGSVEEPVITMPAPEIITPAEGYPAGVTISFVAFAPAGLMGTAIVSGMPESITSVMTDGTKDGTALSEPAEPSLSDPTSAVEYVFRGWYYDTAGVAPYRFGEAIPSEVIQDGEVTLYALWTRKGSCSISFDAKLPENVISGNEPAWEGGSLSVTGKYRRTMSVETGTRLTSSLMPQLDLMGNVDYKVKNYEIDVVTVTSQQINQGGNIGSDTINKDAELINQGLIEKANVIILSPQSHFYEPVTPPSHITEITQNNSKKKYYTFGEAGAKKTAVEIFRDNINTALFDTGKESREEGSYGTYGFLTNDLCWEVILSIFNEVILEEEKAALIYDAECYHMALINGAPGMISATPKKLLFGEKTSMNLEQLTGRNYANAANSNNVYKLYLMMNQMNPQLYYETFLRDHIYVKMKNDGGNTLSTGCYRWVENTGEVNNEDTHWNSATFLLCALLDETEGNIRIKDGTIQMDGNPWEKWGVVSDVYTLSDDKEDGTGIPNQESGIIKGNCFTYESNRVNLTDFFATDSTIPFQKHVSDVFDFFHLADGECTMSEILYYLIQIATGQTDGATRLTAYDKDIRVLELQPSESFLAPLNWLWNINTYVDHFTGSMTVTQQNSSEFNGKIEDLHSEYDLLYIGSDISAYNQGKMVYPQEIINTYADTTARSYDAGRKVTLAESTTVSYQKVVKRDYAAGSNVTIAIPQYVWVISTPYCPPGEYVIEVDQTGNLPIKRITIPHGDESKYTAHELNEIKKLDGNQVINIPVHAGATIELAYGTNVRMPSYEWVSSGTRTLAKSQQIEEYMTVTEWLPAGTTVTLTSNASLRAVHMPDGTALYPYSYVHTGAKIKLSDDKVDLQGILGGNSDHENTYFYSGNDITEIRCQEILEFAASGYPVIVSNRLMKLEADGSLSVNTMVVDSASNLYRMLTELAEGANHPESEYYGNFYYEGGENKTLRTALSKTKCELRITKMPVLYQDGTSIAESYLNGKDGEIDQKNIEITFQIIDDINSSYQMYFYIDQNADGRYTEEERMTGKLEVYEMIAGTKKPVTQLRPNRSYTMCGNLEDYVGVVPWKLEVQSIHNPVIRDSEIECSAILPKADEKPVLQVLQIISDEVPPAGAPTYYKTTIYLPTKVEAERLEAQYQAWIRSGGTTDMEELSVLLSNNDASLTPFLNLLTDIPTGDVKWRISALGFWLYMRQVRDFYVEATRMTIQEFINETARKKSEDSREFNTWAADTYDMIILGFRDCYQDIENDDALDVIETFIASGKQTMFTHDTTSFRNKGRSSEITGEYWGYNINRIFRNVLGMDRFGSTLMYPLDINGNLLSGGLSISEAIRTKKDAPYRTGTSQATTTDAELRANVWNNGASSPKYYVQGYADSFLYRFTTAGLGAGSHGGTTNASKLNRGQLTEYPYRVGNDISVAETHSQYYQLDLEADDIVVWYTLESSGAGDNYADAYHDARNNYYLYSRSNIIYTGVGHDANLTADEFKLFVNTFVASYRIPAEPPTINVQNSSRKTEDGTDCFYIDFDSRDETLAISADITQDAGMRQYQRIQFVINQSTPLKNQTLSMEYYLTADSATGVELREQKDNSGSTKGSGYYVTQNAEGQAEALKLDGNPLRTYSADTGAEATSMLTGEEYYVDIPLELLSGKDGTNLTFRIQICYGRGKEQYVYAYRQIRLLRRGLYDLD